MPPNDHRPRGLAVPSSRLARLSRFGGLAGGLAGGAMAEGMRQVASGRRPALRDMFLTPGNAARVTGQLAQMRGAAMKVGQLISMEAGDMLPPELSQILSHLRNDAHFMPPAQLKTVLTANWGADFQKRFARFDVRPVAAASIGQVHRARTREGRDLAIKVQYPGVRRSIDSDVANVATLIRLSGMVPAGLDLSPLLDEARDQLHEEADYRREAENLSRFGALLADAPEFLVPALEPDLTTGDILAMDYVESRPVEELAEAPQADRDRAVERLIALLLRELFEFGLMQTDPNFANYRYQPETGRIVLLDFGATRAFDDNNIRDYRHLMRVGLAGDRTEIAATLQRMALLHPASSPAHVEAVLSLFETAMAPLRSDAPFDFGASDLITRMRDGGFEIATERSGWTVPPIDTLHLQRKVGGIYLLAARLRARTAIAPLLAPYA